MALPAVFQPGGTLRRATPAAPIPVGADIRAQGFFSHSPNAVMVGTNQWANATPEDIQQYQNFLFRYAQQKDASKGGFLSHLGEVAGDIAPLALAALGGAGLTSALGGAGGAGAITGAGGAETLAGAASAAEAAGAAGAGAIPAWAPSAAGTTFATGSAIGPALLEASTLAAQGLTAAEMTALGISPQIAALAASGAAGPIASSLQAFGAPSGVPTTGVSNLFSGGGSNRNLLGSILGGVGSIIGAGIQANAAEDAAATQAASGQAAIGEQRRQFDLTRSDLAPWLSAGRTALSSLAPMVGFTTDPVTGQPIPSSDLGAILRQDPEYQFQLGEGLRSVEGSAAARGGLLSGPTLKGLERYSQGLASNAFTNRYNRLALLSGLGQTTGNQLGQFGQNTAQNVGNTLTGIGNAQAAGQIGQANAYTGGLQGLANAFAGYQQNQMLQDVLSRFGQQGTTAFT